jgi:glutathionylspermidine synthase
VLPAEKIVAVDAGAEARAYAEWAAKLTATGILSDPWLDGHPRFREKPVTLTLAQRDKIYRAAEGVGAVYDELVRICAADEELVRRYFGLTPWQQMMWSAAAPLWHGIARADVFLTDEGTRICELNCDTPSGEAETVLLNAATLDAEHDPNRELGARFCRMIEAVGARFLDGKRPLSVGIVYPTELTEDLSMIKLYQRWLEKRGARVTLGSPFNLRRTSDGGAALFDARCDVFLRHYKTDWWGERLPIWDDEEPFSDPHPLAGPLSIILGAELAGKCAVVNPFAAIVPQNKRAMAVMWEEIGRFSSVAQAAIRKYIPVTVRAESLPREQLVLERPAWVLKSDYGCEGAEVIIGADTTPEIWEQSLLHAVPGRWVAQRWFRALPDERGESVNYGVYLVAGAASAIFSRVQAGATDCYAVTAPTRIEGP